MLFKEENIYLNIARKIVAEGHVDTSRTGISIRKLHAQHMEFSLANGRIPVLSSRKVPLKAPIVELLWFISGKTNIKFLKENNSSIWDSWVIPGTEVYQNDIDTGIQALVSQGKIKLKPEFENREKLKDFLINYGGSASVNQMLEDLTGGSAPNMRLVDGSIGLGAYGAQWRNWRDVRIVENDNMVELGKLAKRGYDNMNEDIFPNCIAESTPDFTVMTKGYDQLQDAIDLIKNNPDSRRIIVSAWNPGKLDLASLPACHSFFQFLPYERNGITYLDLALTCRSQDFLVGTVFNVFQYGVLCHLVAHITGRIAGKLYWTGNNTHIYENQVQIFEEQHSERSPLSNPDLRLNINSDQPINNIDDFTLDMLSVSGYDNYDEVITYPIAV
jgi:thymidylate synthase